LFGLTTEHKQIKTIRKRTGNKKKGNEKKRKKKYSITLHFDRFGITIQKRQRDKAKRN